MSTDESDQSEGTETDFIQGITDELQLDVERIVETIEAANISTIGQMTTDQTETTNSTLEKFLGAGIKARTEDRTSLQVIEGAKVYPKEKREKLREDDNKAYHRMIEKCCERIKDAFRLMTPIDENSSQESFDRAYNVVLKCKQLQEFMIAMDMEDVFVIAKSYDEDGLPNTEECVNLLETCHGVTMDIVLKGSALYALKSAADWHPQNILWSGKAILNSCHESLKDKLVEAAEVIDPELRGGPVYLMLMNKLILATSEKAMRGLTDKLSSLKLSDFDGENVLKCGSYLKSVLTLLGNHNKVPHDINLLLFAIFKHCSTTEFVDFVKSIESLIDTSAIFGKDFSLSPEKILNELESKYSDLLGRDKWEAKSTKNNQNSAFSAEISGNQNDVICYNCGELGHILTDCKKPKNDAAIAARRAIITGNKSGAGHGGGRGGRGRGRGKGRGGRSGRGRGGRGGNGGRGGSNTPTQENTQNSATNTQRELKTPPKPNESHTKKIDGNELHWCGRCGKWTDHGTADHPSQSESAGSGGANTGPEGGVALQLLSGAMAQNF